VLTVLPSAIICNQPIQSTGLLCREPATPVREIQSGLAFHGRFLRPEDFWLQNDAILRNALRILND
jgi:hypothetical protein